MKVACSFIITKFDNDGKHSSCEVDDYSVVCSDQHAYGNYLLFEEDILENFRSEEAFEKLELDKLYFVYYQAHLSPYYSNSLEGGTEFEGWEFTDSIVILKEME